MFDFVEQVNNRFLLAIKKKLDYPISFKKSKHTLTKSVIMTTMYVLKYHLNFQIVQYDHTQKASSHNGC